jgi:hypothetical protein
LSADPVRPDIADRTDISRLVSEFYRRVFADDLLRPDQPRKFRTV